MGFLKTIFGNDKNENADFWHSIESDEDLEEVKKNSESEKVIIFKHSTRCFISKSVLKNFENEVRNEKPDVRFYFLDILKFRNLSDAIARDYKVVHQSPQILVIKDGAAVYNASHEQINLKTIP